MDSKPNKVKMDKVLATVSLSIVFLSVIALSVYSKESIAFAEKILFWSTSLFSAPVLLFGFFACVFVAGLAFSKYGHIKLGEGKPEYSTSSWIFMFILAGLGSSTLYWGFLDWAYYYQTPGLNIAAKTPEALKYSVPYTMFHWTISAWSIYALASVSVCYSFHVRKNKGLSLASIMESITGFKATGVVGRSIDLLFLLCMFGALTISLVLTAITFTNILSALTGIPNTFMTNAIIVLFVSILFGLSSYVGMDKGMQRLSSMVCYAVFAFALYVFIFGPSQFILNNTITSIGLMFSNFVSMSLFTDPLGDGKFTREWTVFYWLWWTSYAPGVALFVTRVSKGRTIKEVLLAMVLGGSAGMWVFFGIMENYSIFQFLHGVVNVPEVLSAQGGEVAIAQLLNLLPGGTLMMWIFLAIMVIFLAAHMDAVGYAVSATCSKGLQEGQDPSQNVRLFWCVMLTLVPLAMIFSKAPLDTMKAATIVTALPFIIIILVQTFGLVRWLREDYAKLPSYMIEKGEKSDTLKRIQESNEALIQQALNANALNGELNSEHERKSV
ncbi:BCCT family transporter [Acinetobacter wuhouensis]|uniref:BCCT family transporter n=1 Tax=Acinetobacter wuhouensis TaxID=1879050 RepID=A0A3G2SYP1_9GAMM|nr:BCCT family transporter [Acinetobacter wuhouensis]AYO52817.1 BCCT family transporter [Acinetobacter wuhouensis]